MSLDNTSDLYLHERRTHASKLSCPDPVKDASRRKKSCTMGGVGGLYLE
jgi:hypothetical protein